MVSFIIGALVFIIIPLTIDLTCKDMGWYQKL